MNVATRLGAGVVALAAAMSAGCMVKNIDLSRIAQPERAAALDAYDVFVGEWSWEAAVQNTDGPGKYWQGQAKWQWTLGKRCLTGTLSAKSDVATYNATGLWSWNPKTRAYEWSVFNDWGYTQHGSAKYDDAKRCWRMPFRGTGLDGTTSYGEHRMTVIDNDHLEWAFEEWTGPLHLIQKTKITATYTRTK